MYDAGTIEADLVLDRKPFTAALAAARKQAARFEKDAIEPRVEIDGLGEAQTELARLRRELEGLEGDAKVDLDTAPARAKLAALQARLERLEADEVEIDVDVRRGIDDEIARVVESIADLRRESVGARRDSNLFARALSGLARTLVPLPFVRLGDGVGGLGTRLAGLREGLSDTRVHLGLFSVSLKNFARTLAVGVTGAVSLVGALGALGSSFAAAIGGAVSVIGELISSLSYATAGVGALATSFGSLLVPSVILGIGVVQRFQAQSEKAGTAAHALAHEAGRFGQAFRQMTAQGADRVLRGIATALESMRPVLTGLRQEFTNFGAVVGQAFARLGQEFSSGRWQQFFSFLTNAAARAVGPLTTSFISLSRVMRDIAQAAMPFLQSGLRSLASFLQGLARSTSDIGALRESIGGLVDHLRSWWELATQVGRVMLAFFSALAPQGKAVVDSLADGARELANWARSAEGVSAIREAVAGMVSHLREWAELAGQVGRVMLNFFKAAAPAGREMVNWLTEGARKVADFLASAEGKNSVAEFFRDTMPLAKELIGLVGDVAALFVEFAQVTAPVLRPIVAAIREVIQAFTDLLRAIQDLPGPIQAVVGALLAFGPVVGTLKVLGFLFKPITKGIGLLASAIGRLMGGGALGGLTGALSRVGPALGRLVPLFGRFAGPVGIAIAYLTDFEGSLETSTGALQSVVNFLNPFKTAVSDSMGKAASAVRGVPPAIQQMAGAVVAGTARATGGFKRMQVGVAAAVQGVGRSAALAIGNILPRMAQLGRGMAENVARGIRGAGNAAAQAARGLAQNASKAARSLANSFRAVGRTLGNTLAAGHRSTQGQNTSAARTVGMAARNAVAALRGAYQSAGKANGSAVAAGVKSTSGAVASAAKAVASAGQQAAGSMTGSFQSAGKAMGDAVAAGIRSAIAGIAAAARAAAQAARNAFPGSEPKDPRSPLRNLADAGRATIDNYIAGLDAARMADAMRRTMGPTRREIERPGLTGDVGDQKEGVLKILGEMAKQSAGPPVVVEPIAALPDGRTLGLIGGLATAGQSRQPHRTNSRRRVRG